MAGQSGRGLVNVISGAGEVLHCQMKWPIDVVILNAVLRASCCMCIAHAQICIDYENLCTVKDMFNGEAEQVRLSPETAWR